MIINFCGSSDWFKHISTSIPRPKVFVACGGAIRIGGQNKSCNVGMFSRWTKEFIPVLPPHKSQGVSVLSILSTNLSHLRHDLYYVNLQEEQPIPTPTVVRQFGILFYPIDPLMDIYQHHFRCIKHPLS